MNIAPNPSKSILALFAVSLTGPYIHIYMQQQQKLVQNFGVQVCKVDFRWDIEQQKNGS